MQPILPKVNPQNHMYNKQIKQENISHKATFDGLSSTVGFIILLVGLVLFLYVTQVEFSVPIIILDIIISLFGFVLLLSVRGVLINHESGLVMPYLDIVGFKVGNWKPLKQYDKIQLHYINSSQTMNYKSISTKVAVRRFEVKLTSVGAGEILLKAFSNYTEANTFLIEYSKSLNKELVDNYEILREQLSARRGLSNR